MLDLGNLPIGGGTFSVASGKGDLQVFTTPSTTTNLQWCVWRKPRGCNMFYAFMLGGGGGGGGGFTRTAGSAGGGGGGGGSSGQTVTVGPLFLLPDMLYVQVGAGGAGRSSGGGTADSGGRSYLSVFPDTTTNNILLTCSPTAATGGGTGTGAAVGAAGSGGTVTSITNQYFNSLCTFQSIAGVNGTAGGAIAGANGGALTLPATGAVTTGGTGGAGCTTTNFLGGAFTAVASTLVSESRPATSAATGGAGSDGSQLWKPLFFFGGGGGSSNNSGVAGNGGNGADGAGGGGGGAGATGGTGGQGGNGIVIIYCW